MKAFLGFDTSCYTTSAAAVDEEGKVLASERLLLPVAKGQRGLRQSEAVFVHVRQMPQVMERLAPALRGREIAAVCASNAPRDEEESYMPVFTVGLGHASALSSALNAPLFTVSHQQGHIAAGRIENPPMEERFLALHLSGGTTELLLCDHGKLTLIGASLDLHAGQLVDRVGVALSLPFPAGPELEKLALLCGEPSQALLPASTEKGGLFCHLSGAETACQRLIRQGDLPRERIAAEVYDLLARTVSRMLLAGAQSTGAGQALVVGGVASSALLRRLVLKRVEKGNRALRVLFGMPRYSADNAAGVARLCWEKYAQLR